MGEVIVIKIILLHLIAEAIVCFLGMITMDHTTIQKYLRGTLFIVVLSMMGFIRVCNN